MRRNLIRSALLGGLMLGAFGCSQQQIDTTNRNFLATLCANGATIISQLPTGILTPAQIQNIHDVACSTAFGTTPAPTTAPGNQPVFPAPAVK